MTDSKKVQILKTKSEVMGDFIIKQLKKAPESTIQRLRLWRLYTVSPLFKSTDTSAIMSTVIKTLMNNGKVEIVFIENKKCIKLR